MFDLLQTVLNSDRISLKASITSKLVNIPLVKIRTYLLIMYT